MNFTSLGILKDDIRPLRAMDRRLAWLSPITAIFIGLGRCTLKLMMLMKRSCGGWWTTCVVPPTTSTCGDALSWCRAKTPDPKPSYSWRRNTNISDWLLIRRACHTYNKDQSRYDLTNQYICKSLRNTSHDFSRPTEMNCLRSISDYKKAVYIYRIILPYLKFYIWGV